MRRNIGILMLLLLGNTLLFAQNYRIGDVITNLDGTKGVVFWVNADRTEACMVALEDASASCQWGKKTVIQNLPATSSWSTFQFDQVLSEMNGKTNTQKIRDKAQTTSGWPIPYAAGVVDYDHDWYLPSVGQLRILFGNLALVEASVDPDAGFNTLSSSLNYWSSTQNSQDNAWMVKGSDGSFSSVAKTNSNAVRAVRTVAMTGGFARYQWTPTHEVSPDILAFPTETTTYTVTTSMGNSCAADDAQLLTVSQVEDEDIMASICESETYYWEGDPYTEAGNYTKVFTNDEGCEYLVTLHLSVIPSPTVTVTTVPDPPVVCEGESVTIHAEASIVRPAIGDILCTDNSVVKPEDWPVAGKTAKGVVFYVDEYWQHGWAIGLNDVGQHRWCNAATLVAGLTNYTSPREAMYDFDGAANTQIIRAAGNATQFAAAWSVDVANGWYLPAIGQLRYLYANLYTVNAGLQTVNGTPFSVTSAWSYWSSSQYDASKKWMLGSRGDVKEQTGTATTVKIRAVCSF